MNSYENVETEINYLLQFYTHEEIDRFAEGDNDKIRWLYEEAQPVTVPIGSLKGDIDNSDYCYIVDSPDGWVPVLDCVEKIKDEMYIVEVDCNTRIEASHDHLFQKSDLSWWYARDLKEGDALLVQEGKGIITSITPYNERTEVYDLSVGHDNHRYYTDGVCSHNTGKSLFLQNHAINHWKNGMNVLQITLELHPELVSRRMDCMFLNKSQDELYSDLNATAIEFAMEKKKHNVGELRVKYMPSGTKTSEIKNLVKMYMNDTKKPVDILVVDYIDLVDPITTYKAGDTFNKDKMVSEELRNIGQELGPIVISASQLNRCLTLDTKVEIEGTGEIDIKNIKVGDRIRTNTGYNTVKDVMPVTKRKVYEIRTKSGKVIRCSDNHVFPTKNGEVNIANGLSVGDVLYSKR